jgi:hypothetical protein
VPALLNGPGQYEVRFLGTKGSDNALEIARVALAAGPPGPDGKLTEIAADEHPGVAGWNWYRDNRYALRWPVTDGTGLYYVVADIAASGINRVGAVYMAKKRASGETVPDATLLPPDPNLDLYYKGPDFAAGKIRVGVVGNGAGWEPVWKRLQGVDGVDAKRIYLLPSHIRNCQVVVYTQPRGSVTAGLLDSLRQFVQGGGGLVVTHDAVGYRHQPVLAPEVCMKGVARPLDAGWKAEGKSPLTEGLGTEGVLAMTYYDLIALEAGPQGTVVARGVPSGKPAVIGGNWGTGRFVACGLLLGVGKDEKDAGLTPDEGTLLENVVRWAAGQERAR